MIIKEIPHISPTSRSSAKARAKQENRQQARVITGVVAELGNSAVSALSKLSKSTQGAKKTKTTQQRSFGRTIAYAIKGETSGSGELLYSQNLDMLEPEMVRIAMETTAKMNHSVKNPCKHFVISWAGGESPSTNMMKESVELYLKSAGYAEHQAVAYEHNDNGISHIHIIANHVHPVSYKAVHRSFIKGKANHKNREKVARSLELKYGLRRVEGKHFRIADNKVVGQTDKSRFITDNKIGDKSLSTERNSGLPSFERWIKEGRETKKLAAQVTALLNKPGANWQSIHALLATYNIQLQLDKRGKGFVLADKDLPDVRHVKASTIRELSFGSLQKRLKSDYQAPTADIFKVEPAASYGAMVSLVERENALLLEFKKQKTEYKSAVAALDTKSTAYKTKRVELYSYYSHYVGSYKAYLKMLNKNSDARSELKRLGEINPVIAAIELSPQDIVVSVQPPKTDITPHAEPKVEKIQEVVQTPDTTRCADPGDVAGSSWDTTSGEPAISQKPFVSPTQSDSVTPLLVKESNQPTQQPASDFVVKTEAEPSPAFTVAELAYHAVLRRIAAISMDFVSLHKVLTDGTLFGGAETYNDRTDQLEVELNKLIAPYPGTKIELPYDDTPLIVNGQPITEIIKGLPPEQKPEPMSPKPAPTQSRSR